METGETIGQRFVAACKKFKDLRDSNASYHERREAHFAVLNVVEANIIGPIRTIIRTGKPAIVTLENDKGDGTEDIRIGTMGAIVDGDRMQYSPDLKASWRVQSFSFARVVGIREP